MSISRPSAEGQQALSDLLFDARDRAGYTDWGDFADWLSQVSGMSITKDAVYKVAVANYKVEPPFRVFYALIVRARVNGQPLMRFRDAQQTPVTIGDVGDILYGFVGIDGSRKQPNGVG